MSSRNVRYAAAYCAGLAFAACEPSDEETSEERLGTTSAEIQYLTAIKSMPASGYTHYEAPIGNQFMAVAAAYGGANPHRYILATRNKTQDWINLHNIDANQGGANFGNVTATITTPYSTGNVRDAATIRHSSTYDYALFAYSGLHNSDSGGNFFGYQSVRVLRVTPSLGHASYLIRDCNDASGQLFCRTNGQSIAASTRYDGTDKALVVYALQPNKTVSHATIEAAFITSTGSVTALGSLQACATPPCPVGMTPPQTETAYNRLANLFLTVWALPTTSPINYRGQIFHGTTGAPIGSVIDFGSYFVTGAPRIGVASNPSAADNPNLNWAVLIENVAYSVAPDGTFAQTALPANAQNMESLYTLQSANGFSTGKEYEYLASDWDTGSAVKLWKFDTALQQVAVDVIELA